MQIEKVLIFCITYEDFQYSELLNNYHTPVFDPLLSLSKQDLYNVKQNVSIQLKDMVQRGQ